MPINSHPRSSSGKNSYVSTLAGSGHSDRINRRGAMRPSSALGADGELNIVRAVQVAAHDAARGHGVLIVMNDAVFAARDVTKTATYRVDPGLMYFCQK